MTIKGQNGEEYSVSSAGVGGAGLGLGIAGTALGLLNGGLGILGNRGAAPALGGYGCAADGNFVTKYELSQEQTIAALNSQVALLQADKYTDQKLVEVYNSLFSKISAVEAEVRLNKEQQNAVNAQQQLYNGVNNAAVAGLKAQVAQLLSITKVVIPNGAICPGWGDVTVNAETSTSTGTTSSTSN